MEKVYYHGTNARFLYSILTKGFTLGEDQHGRVHGNGLYVATKPETAAYWAMTAYVHPGQYAVKCKLLPGVRVLWKDADYDKSVIRSLEKRFSKQISRDYAFWKHIPSNKQLTGEELRALVSHLDFISMMNWTRKREKFDDVKFKNLSRFGKLIRAYGYDALGDRTASCWDSDEILVYNPSKVVPISAHHLTVVWDREKFEPVRVAYSSPLSLDLIKKISIDEEADWQKFLAEDTADTADTADLAGEE